MNMDRIRLYKDSEHAILVVVEPSKLTRAFTTVGLPTTKISTLLEGTIEVRSTDRIEIYEKGNFKNILKTTKMNKHTKIRIIRPELKGGSSNVETYLKPGATN